MATLDDIIAAHSASELQRMLEQGRLLSHDFADRIVVAADEIQVALQQITGAPSLLGVDVRMNARRVTRSLRHAARLQTESARAFQGTWRRFQQLYLVRQPGTPKKSFDVTG